MELTQKRIPSRIVDASQLITQAQYAKQKGLARHIVNYQLQIGKLNGVKIDGCQLILKEELIKHDAPEVNMEALKELSISDLSNLLTLIKLYPKTVKKSSTVMPVLTAELQKRMDNLFIF